MPWHILPRKSADVKATLPDGKLPAVDPATGLGTVALQNKGVGDAQVFAYSVLGTGPDAPRARAGRRSAEPDDSSRRRQHLPDTGGPDLQCKPELRLGVRACENMHERKASAQWEPFTKSTSTWTVSPAMTLP